MPSLPHEGLVLLFRNRPELAAELVRDALHVELPRFEHVRVGEADVTQLVPTEYKADLVVLLEHDGVRKPALAIIVETQLGIDANKRWSWPVYITGLRAKLRSGVVLLVVTVDPKVAQWARAPISIGHPGFSLTPLVLGPDDIPVVRDAEQAARAPELSVLSVMAHGQNEPDEAAVQMAKNALVACLKLDDDRALLYSELVLLSLSQAAKAALEKIMASGQFEFQSDFAKKHRAAGRAEGEAKGEAKAVLAVLEARGLAISDDARSRILDCSDLAVLDRWVRKAVTAAATDDLFRE